MPISPFYCGGILNWVGWIYEFRKFYADRFENVDGDGKFQDKSLFNLAEVFLVLEIQFWREV